MPEKVIITNEKGENFTSDLISVFKIPVINKVIVITTKNEVDPNGLTILHVSELDGEQLVAIKDDDLWSKIKLVMRAVVSSSEGEFEYEPLIADAKINGIYSRDISVDNAATKQMIEDYNAKKPVGLPKVEESAIAPASQEQAENPFNSSIYPNGGNNISGNMVAPGISEVQPQMAPNFQQVQNLENPVDLMVNNQQPEMPQMNPQMDPNMMNPQMDPNMMNPQMDPNMMNPQMMQQNMMPQQGIQQQDPMAMLNNNSTIDDAVRACTEMTQAALYNLISFIGMKKNQELNDREDMLNKRENELNAMEQGLQVKLSMQNRQMEQPMYQQNMMPQEPMQQNMQFPQQGMQQFPQQNMMPQEPMQQGMQQFTQQGMMPQEPMQQGMQQFPQQGMMPQEPMQQGMQQFPQQGMMNNMQFPQQPAYDPNGNIIG